jgi:DNA-binding NarL/FixJ family response regulator
MTMPTKRIKVLCVDDSDMVADAVQMKLKDNPRFKWIGHLHSAETLLAETKARHPDVILLDIAMPGPDPFVVLTAMSAECPDSRVLMFSGYVGSDLIDRAVQAGAWGYLAKAETPQKLLWAIEQVAEGQFVLEALTSPRS